MRAVILLFSVIAAVSILWWQAPEMVPLELRHGLVNLEHNAALLISPKAKRAALSASAAKAPSPSLEQGAAMQAPLWPDPLEKPMRKPLPLIPVAVAALIALAGLLLCIMLVRRRAEAARHAMPEWLKAARRLARATNDKSLRLKQCDVIERQLLADMKHRGASALARAHQLDLYWRYVGRSNLMSKSFIKGPELDRWRAVSRQTLEAIAIPPSSRSLAAFRQSQGSLWALEQGDARELKRYYEAVSSQLAQYEEAWKRANAAASKLVIDQPTLLDAMETLRQLNRSMAKQTAVLIGDIEISVRAAR
jgi:hypothetical protein